MSWHFLNLRPYQRECIAAIDAGWSESCRQLIVVPTGGGKTIIFSSVAAANKSRTLILAHREELIDQAIDKLHRSTGIKADKDKAEHVASIEARVVVGSIQTLMRDKRLTRWPSDHFGMVIVDEAHHAISPSFIRVLNHFDGVARVLGVTATPDRGDKKNLGQYFERIAYEVSLFSLIDDGYLSRIAVKSIPLKIDLNAVKQSGGDFDGAELGAALEPYLGEIAGVLKDQCTHRRTLAFLPLRATSRKFVDACRESGLTAEHIDGESPDRKEILARFAAGEFQVLSNAMLLTEGFDDPGIDCVVVLRPTRSRPLYAQMVGRGTRIDEFKDNLLLFDFLWMHQRHSISRPAHLVASSPEEAEIITEISQSAGGPMDEMDLGELSAEAQTKREAALRKWLEQSAKKKATFISAEEFAMQHDALAVAEYEPTMPWESDPVTEKQSRALRRARIDATTVSGKGHANKLLNLFFANQKLTLASEKQRATMRRMGHPNAENATADEARRFFASLNRR